MDGSDKKVVVTEQAFLEMLRRSVNLMKLSELTAEIAETVAKKNHDYGDAWQRYGVFTPLIRLNDKSLRIATLASGEQALVADEFVEDTLRDMVGYAVLALMWFEANGSHKIPEVLPGAISGSQMRLPFELSEAEAQREKISDIFTCLKTENND